MKKIILGFILGIIITGTVVYAGSLIARDIDYDNTSSGLKDTNNQDVDNVQDAIDALYAKANTSNSDTLTINTTISTWTNNTTSNLTYILSDYKNKYSNLKIQLTNNSQKCTSKFFYSDWSEASSVVFDQDYSIENYQYLNLYINSPNSSGDYCEYRLIFS